jgi:hypothetical protein
MARGKNTDDLTTLRMALVGYQIERERIDEKIREIQAHLKGKHVNLASQAEPEKKTAAVKRVLSPAARRRIAAAQKKRWAEHRRRMAQGGKE